jgi:hypothetical protein
MSERRLAESSLGLPQSLADNATRVAVETTVSFHILCNSLLKHHPCIIFNLSMSASVHCTER